MLAWNVAYESLRSATPTRRTAAFENARGVEAFERALHLDLELGLNRWVFGHTLVADFASLWYQLAHLVVTVGVLLWLWHWHPQRYRPLRSTLVGVSIASLVVYRFYPLAPPRLALDGSVDTMLAHKVLFAGWKSVTGLSNLYAAMPSVHVAWATWCALSVVVAIRSPWRHLAWLYPATSTFVVIGTANHYLVDAIAGASGVAVGWALSARLYRGRGKPGPTALHHFDNTRVA